MTGALQSILGAESGEVWGLLFFPETGRFLTGAGDGLRFWEFNGFVPGEAIPLQAPVRSVALSPDRETLAVCEAVWNVPHGIVTLRDARTGELKRKVVELNTSLTRLAFSPDGQFLAVAHFNGGVDLYSVLTGKKTAYFEGTRPLGEGVIFSPDGKYLCAFGGSPDRQNNQTQCGLRLYRLSDGSEVWRNTTMTNCVNAVFSPDGTRLAATDGAQNVYLWKIELPAEGVTRP